MKKITGASTYNLSNYLSALNRTGIISIYLVLRSIYVFYVFLFPLFTASSRNSHAFISSSFFFEVLVHSCFNGGLFSCVLVPGKLLIALDLHTYLDLQRHFSLTHCDHIVSISRE